MPSIKKLDSKVVFQNDFVLAYDDTVEFPNGKKGSYFHTKWTAPYGVAIIPYTSDKCVFIKSRRYPGKEILVECPKGFGIKGSTPEVCARRELLEETGLEPHVLNYEGVVGENFPTHVFSCNVTETPSTAPMSALNEGIEGLIYVPISELDHSFILRHRISCPVTILAIPLLRSGKKDF